MNNKIKLFLLTVFTVISGLQVIFAQCIYSSNPSDYDLVNTFTGYSNSKNILINQNTTVSGNFNIGGTSKVVIINNAVLTITGGATFGNSTSLIIDNAQLITQSNTVTIGGMLCTTNACLKTSNDIIFAAGSTVTAKNSHFKASGKMQSNANIDGSNNIFNFTSSNSQINNNGGIWYARSIAGWYAPGTNSFNVSNDTNTGNIPAPNKSTTVFADCYIPTNHCVKPGATGTPDNYTKIGILTKRSITNSTGSIKWPENVPNGHIVMDSSDKGFVITHMTTAQRDALIPVNGMMIYNTDLRCVQLYRGTAPTADTSRTGWNCIERGCGGCTSNFIWAFPPAPLITNPSGGPYTATGTINGINYIYTSSHTVQGTSGLYGCGNFPASYNVPCSVNPTIRNTQATSNTLTFATPITNPTLLFASVGSNSGGGNLSVPIQFSEDVEIVWSQNVVQNGPRKITGTEGFAIVRFNGTFNSISFDYTVAEDYCNFMFGADFMTCP